MDTPYELSWIVCGSDACVHTHMHTHMHTHTHMHRHAMCVQTHTSACVCDMVCFSCTCFIKTHISLIMLEHFKSCVLLLRMHTHTAGIVSQFKQACTVDFVCWMACITCHRHPYVVKCNVPKSVHRSPQNALDLL